MTILIPITFYQSSIFFFGFFIRLEDFLSINLAGFFYILLLSLEIFYQATNISYIFIITYLTKLMSMKKGYYNSFVTKSDIFIKKNKFYLQN